MDIIDFTNCEEKRKSYDGASGQKICINYQNELYMLKFPNTSKRNKMMSYSNSCISEYIGCHIFETFGIPVQKTLLGIYKTKSGKEKVVVACKDFTNYNTVYQNFASEKNKIIDSDNNGYGTELESVIEAIDHQKDFDPKMLRSHFWNIFIVDALIGNWDRHNGNWGFLYNKIEDKLTLAPVFDCGSSLYPTADDETIYKVFNNEEELKYRIFEIPTSALKEDNKRIKYYDFLYSLKNKDCNIALKNIYKKIDINKIETIVNNTPFITELQKKFFNYMLEKRIELILTPSYNKLIEKERKIQDKKNSYNRMWER